MQQLLEQPGIIRLLGAHDVWSARTALSKVNLRFAPLEGEPPGEPKTWMLQRLGRSLALQKMEP